MPSSDTQRLYGVCQNLLSIIASGRIDGSMTDYFAKVHGLLHDVNKLLPLLPRIFSNNKPSCCLSQNRWCYVLPGCLPWLAIAQATPLYLLILVSPPLIVLVSSITSVVHASNSFVGLT